MIKLFLGSTKELVQTNYQFFFGVNMSIQAWGTHIKVKDIKKSEAFYDALGFKQVFRYGPNEKIKEAYAGIVYEHGGCKLEIADGHRAVRAEVFQEMIQSSKVSMMIYVEDLNDIIRRSKTAKIEISVKPRHYYWGTIELVIKDPDGLVLVFIQQYNDQSSKQLQADEIFAIQPSLD